MKKFSYLYLIICAIYSCLVSAQELLPQPLSLMDALSLSQDHPQVKASESIVDMAAANIDKISSDNDLNVVFQGYLTVVEPSELSPNESNNNSKALLLARKKLYDFGYSDAQKTAAQTLFKSKKNLLLNKRQQHQLTVIADFYDVLVADKYSSWRDETTTYAFFKYNKNQDFHEFGKVSDIELLRTENIFREERHLRTLAEQQQQITRIQLSDSLNRPGDLASELLMPVVDWEKPIPLVDTILEKALQNNPGLIAAKTAVQAAKEELIAVNASDNAVIHGEVMAADYRRKTGSTHPLSAGLVIEVPLYSGGKIKSDIAIARAQLSEQQSLMRLVELSIRQTAAELYVQLNTVKDELAALKVSEDYGELYLDKNRALYELEVASDFGDAMVRVSEVDYKKTKALLSYALLEAKLLALQGELILPVNR